MHTTKLARRLSASVAQVPGQFAFVPGHAWPFPSDLPVVGFSAAGPAASAARTTARFGRGSCCYSVVGRPRVGPAPIQALSSSPSGSSGCGSTGAVGSGRTMGCLLQDADELDDRQT